ncbi:MAG: putative outer membrane protein precursor [Bacteroidetes bacterium ADurb.Bin041]|jgi:long-chain fatty acid transport protein|nr:MAG: putative outer membrane protein precursor [Bacteroidetes bacterium ADurb.Bin041]
MKFMRKIVTLLLLGCLVSSSLFAGGYQVRLQGQRQTGMGLIGTSLYGDASNLFYNPAGLSKLNGKFSFAAGFSPIFNEIAFRLENDPVTVYNDNPVGTPFSVYGSMMITKRLGFGIGAYTPYGSTAIWGNDWVGATLIQDLSLQAVFIQPTISYNFADVVSIGAGLVIASGEVELNKAIPYNGAEVKGQITLNGKTTEYGYNVGLLITPNKKWAIGANYRSEIIMSVQDGDATFTIPGSLYSIIPANNKFDADLPLPANFDFGLSFKASEKLLLAAEINYVFWDVYDSLNFTFKKMPAILNSSNPRLYSNTLLTRVGAEYTFNEVVKGRAGIYYDPTPTHEEYFSPETPSLSSFAFTLGISLYPIENFAIDISYLQLETKQEFKTYKPSNFQGDYKSRTLIPGVGLTYTF